MDIAEALKIIVEAKDKTIEIQEKYYADTYALLVDALKINASLTGANNNVPMLDEPNMPMHEIVEELEDTSVTGGEIGG